MVIFFLLFVIIFETLIERIYFRGLRGKLKAFMYIFDQPFQEYNIRKFTLVIIE